MVTLTLSYLSISVISVSHWSLSVCTSRLKTVLRLYTVVSSIAVIVLRLDTVSSYKLAVHVRSLRSFGLSAVASVAGRAAPRRRDIGRFRHTARRNLQSRKSNHQPATLCVDVKTWTARHSVTTHKARSGELTAVFRSNSVSDVFAVAAALVRGSL